MPIDDCPNCGGPLDDAETSQAQCPHCSAVLAPAEKSAPPLSLKSTRLIHPAVGRADADDDRLLIQLKPDRSQAIGGGTILVTGLILMIFMILRWQDPLPDLLKASLFGTWLIMAGMGLSVTLARLRSTDIRLTADTLSVRGAPGLFLKQILYTRSLRIPAEEIEQIYVSSARWAHKTGPWHTDVTDFTHYDLCCKVRGHRHLLARIQCYGSSPAQKSAHDVERLLEDRLGIVDRPVHRHRR